MFFGFCDGNVDVCIMYSYFFLLICIDCFQSNQCIVMLLVKNVDNQKLMINREGYQ